MDESVVREFEQQQVGKLKMSQAIRIGEKLHPQGTGALYHEGKTCALGAAFVATFGRTPKPVGKADSDYQRLYAAYPGIHSIRYEIWERNDVYKMTREAIADWLESQGL